eukprot:CAMPEP_0179167726 /NCGR_PEP_ID=MMETSP0796-20121207/82480_1 /TAXON_ID=73915 /ORGANISM="Pyrodinium bahamense, Strain pbaha01" /LENGTH=87 /DNA_ID=CAMNT_0020870449 /DNA_START=173 /DNA_END=433 /DNA_ORIENTATION=-
MTSARAQQQLQKDGTLVVFTPGRGKVLFISHQWVGSMSPDPDFQQLCVLQEALQSFITGNTHISLHLASQLFWGMSETITAHDFEVQ